MIESLSLNFDSHTFIVFINSFLQFCSLVCTKHNKILHTHPSADRDNTKIKVRQLGCTILHLDQVPDDDTTICFALGGSSLGLIQLFTHYQLFLSHCTHLNMLDLLIQPTIAKHVRLLTTIENTKRDKETIPVVVHVRHETQGK